MATPAIDISLLTHIRSVFVFLFIFGIVYAFLEKSKIFGANKGLNSLVAFSIAILFILTEAARTVVNFVTPWFVVFFVMLLFFAMIFMFMGVKEESFATAFKDPAVYYTVLIIFLIIFGIAMSKVFGEQLASTQDDVDIGDEGLGKTVAKILFDPKILGMFLLIIIASFAVRFISVSSG